MKDFQNSCRGCSGNLSLVIGICRFDDDAPVSDFDEFPDAEHPPGTARLPCRLCGLGANTYLNAFVEDGHMLEDQTDEDGGLHYYRKLDHIIATPSHWEYSEEISPDSLWRRREFSENPGEDDAMAWVEVNPRDDPNNPECEDSSGDNGIPFHDIFDNDIRNELLEEVDYSWRLFHGPTPTCYLKIWLHHILFDRGPHVLDSYNPPFDLNNARYIVTDLKPYEWSGADPGGNGTCLKYLNPDSPILHNSAATAIQNYIVSDPLSYPTGMGTNNLRITKYSFVKDYEPVMKPVDQLVGCDDPPCDPEDPNVIYEVSNYFNGYPPPPP